MFSLNHTDAPEPYTGIATPQASLGFPKLLDFHRAHPLLAQAARTPEHPLLGVDGEGLPVTMEMPHLLLSAGTGGGKSSILRGITAQAMHTGAQVVFLDVKQHSHRWAKDLPPTQMAGYAKTLPEIGNALVALGMEVHRRNAIIADPRNMHTPIEDIDVGPRLFIAFEEMNATIKHLKDLDKRREVGTYSAMDAYGEILLLGRAAKMHMLGVAQYADSKATGGTDMRENFGTRVLIRYSKNAWIMLTDIWPPQSAPKAVGRGKTCQGDVAQDTQFLYMTEAEARAYALPRLEIES